MVTLCIPANKSIQMNTCYVWCIWILRIIVCAGKEKNKRDDKKHDRQEPPPSPAAVQGDHSEKFLAHAGYFSELFRADASASPNVAPPSLVLVYCATASFSSAISSALIER